MASLRFTNLRAGQPTPTCPRSGHWVNTIRFTYADGVTQATETRQRCRRA